MATPLVGGYLQRGHGEEGRWVMEGRRRSKKWLRFVACTFAAMFLLTAVDSRGSLVTALASSPRLQVILHTDIGDVSSAAFSPDGRLLAFGTRDKTVILWDVATRKRLGSPLTGHTDVVCCLVFSPDGKILASGSHEIILWDVMTQKRLGSAPDSDGAPIEAF